MLMSNRDKPTRKRVWGHEDGPIGPDCPQSVTNEFPDGYPVNVLKGIQDGTCTVSPQMRRNWVSEMTPEEVVLSQSLQEETNNLMDMIRKIKSDQYRMWYALNILQETN